MGIREEIAEESQTLERAELIRARRGKELAEREVARLLEELEKTKRALDIVGSLDATQLAPPKWLRPTKSGTNRATLAVMLSDTHFDEVVNPDELDGLNAYNREIALLRLQRWSQNVVKMARHYLAGMEYDGLVLLLGGDIFSGDIHEELAETNEDTTLSSLLYWSEQLAAAIDFFASEFGRVHVAAVMGNHGRTSRKPRAKLRAKTNFDWLLAKMLERYFRSDERVSFNVPESADVLVDIYGHGQLMTHGDQVHGGGGIGGIYPPIMRLRARKQQRHLQVGSSFATLWMGHWHQYLSTPSLIINGSLKGYDEYAMVSNFAYEQPQQALAVVTPERGITIQAPVFCMDRKREKW
jgi:hypothetical protein